MGEPLEIDMSFTIADLGRDDQVSELFTHSLLLFKKITFVFLLAGIGKLCLLFNDQHFLDGLCPDVPHSISNSKQR